MYLFFSMPEYCPTSFLGSSWSDVTRRVQYRRLVSTDSGWWQHFSVSSTRSWTSSLGYSVMKKIRNYLVKIRKNLYFMKLNSLCGS